MVRGDLPTVVGINRTQDASIAVARGGAHLASLQKERLTRRKHHWGRLGDVRDLYRSTLPELGERVDLVVDCYPSDTEVEHPDAYHDELAQSLRFRNGRRAVRVSYHLAHVYSAFPPSPFERAAVMIGDAQGSPVRDITEPFPGAAEAAPALLEVASFYRCDRGGSVACLGKQLWDGDWSRPAGLGCFYSLLTRGIFPDGEGNEGKVMGLAPFGRPDALGLPDLVVDEHRVLIPPPPPRARPRPSGACARAGAGRAARRRSSTPCRAWRPHGRGRRGQLGSRRGLAACEQVGAACRRRQAGDMSRRWWIVSRG